MSALSEILDDYRKNPVTEREKGTYFEELIACYLWYEASYKDLYSDVWTYDKWARLQGLDERDTAQKTPAPINTMQFTDASDWTTETMGDPKHPMELFQRVITVSIETMKIIKGLPALDI